MYSSEATENLHLRNLGSHLFQVSWGKYVLKS